MFHPIERIDSERCRKPYFRVSAQYIHQTVDLLIAKDVISCNNIWNICKFTRHAGSFQGKDKHRDDNDLPYHSKSNISVKWGKLSYATFSGKKLAIFQSLGETILSTRTGFDEGEIWVKWSSVGSIRIYSDLFK